MKTLSELQKKTSEVTDSILEGNFDLYDYCHERADSDSRVIYYSQAREYVLNYPDESELEEEWKDLGFEFTDLNTLFSQLAFIGVRKEFEAECFEDINRDIAIFENALNELSQLKEDYCNKYIEGDLSNKKYESIEIEIEGYESELEDAISELEEYV